MQASEAIQVFTRQMPRAFNDKLAPKTFIRSMFKTVTTSALKLSREVKRYSERIAVDQDRSAEGQLNTAGLRTAKQEIPPFYREFFPISELNYYDRVFGTDGNVRATEVEGLIDEVSDMLSILQYKIDRTIEKNCVEAIFSRTVTTDKYGTYDFKKKAASVITPPFVWSNASAKPLDDLQKCCKFVRTKGKARGSQFNAIMGETSVQEFFNNAQVKEFGEIRRITTVQLGMPTYMEDTGAVFHGQVAAGEYVVNVWSYPEFYDDGAGNSIPYIGAEQVAVIPMDPGFELNFGGVPSLQKIGIEANAVKMYVMKAGEFHVRKYDDHRAANTFFEVSSANLPIPVFVDRVASMST